MYICVCACIHTILVLFCQTFCETGQRTDILVLNTSTHTFQDENILLRNHNRTATLGVLVYFSVVTNSHLVAENNTDSFSCSSGGLKSAMGLPGLIPGISWAARLLGAPGGNSSLASLACPATLSSLPLPSSKPAVADGVLPLSHCPSLTVPPASSVL